jgi:pyochelin biosynthetic protein PchG
VLQEHPLHYDELVGCLRTAHGRGVVYRLNTHYVHLEPVRQFIRAARALLREQRALFVEAACGLPTAYTLFDVLGQVFGGVRPWAFDEPSRRDHARRGVCQLAMPFRTLEGAIAGVPFSLRLQHQLAPAEPDNHVHLFHRITLGTEGGTLTLVNTHGPTIWSPRPHMPADAEEAVGIECSTARHLDYPSATPIGAAWGPSYREILRTVWPSGVRRALRAMRSAIIQGKDSQTHGQYCLSLCRLWQDATSRLGAVELLRQEAPRVLSADQLCAAAAAPEQEDEWV